MLGALPGCGSKPKSDADKVKDTMTGFLKAVGDGDGGKACAMTTQSGREKLMRAAKGVLSCESVIAAIASKLPDEAKTGLKNAKVQRATVRGNTATVLDQDITSTKGNVRAFLTTGTPTKFIKQGGNWKISG
jgi:hypothetical protein